MEEKSTEDIKEKLKNILGISKCNHKVEIMKETDIKRAHIYSVYNATNSERPIEFCLAVFTLFE